MKITFTLIFLLLTLSLLPLIGQEPEPGDDTSTDTVEGVQQTAQDLLESTKEQASRATDAARAKAIDLAESDEARKASTAVLEWIQSADSLYRPWINWAMVAVGIALFTSHAGQLVVGKFWTLIRGKGFNVCEIINDLLVTAFSGLALPVVLLIPTGRGAFISSPLAVLSAAAVGLIIGVFLYTHGMKQEMLAGQERIDRKRAGES